MDAILEERDLLDPSSYSSLFTRSDNDNNVPQRNQLSNTRER